MGIIEIILLAIGLSMDAFAVAICKGLAMEKVSIKKVAIVGAWFGGFQALMPLIGFLLGVSFKDYIVAIDHWISFALLGLIGFNMIKESLSKDEDEENSSLAFKLMLVLAVATSIDALAVGVTFAFLQVNVVLAVIIIGITTFILSSIGVKIGNVFGARYKSKAEFAGGLILILLGVKILLEHLGVINF